MNSKAKVCLFGLCAALASGCEVAVTPGTVTVDAPPPPVVVVGPPPVYVWDGVEFVGEVNGGYVYLNGGGVWVHADPVVLGRFHGWASEHPDWRRTAVHYDHAHRPDPHRPPARRPEERERPR